MPAEGKIKKAGREHLELVLEPTADVLAGLALARREGRLLVGFAAEHGQQALESPAASSRPRRSTRSSSTTSPAPTSASTSTPNEVTILTRRVGDAEPGELHVPRARKAQIAEAILDVVQELRTGG